MSDENDAPPGAKTETIVREYGEDGTLTSETKTTVVKVTPTDTGKPPGMYL